MGKLVEDCSKLGFGLMRLPRLEDKTIDIEQSSKMVDDFLAAGGRYFDTAFIYEGSEEATSKILCDRYPRESYYLATKVNAKQFCCANAEDARNQIKISLERSHAGYFDFYLLHALDKDNVDLYEEYGLWDYLKELKEEGLIKHFGFSFHDRAWVLDEILTKHPEAEFVQLQINYADWDDSNVEAKDCYEVAVKHGKPVVVMEPVKGGLLAAPPECAMKILKEADPDASAASWAIRFVASLENVMVVLSGMSNTEQMADNLSYMKNFKPFTKEEDEVIVKVREAFKSVDRIPCTGCNYCTKGCPAGINIPGNFAVMNSYKLYLDLDRAKGDLSWRPGGAKPSACIQCGQCESACPQHLPIIEHLHKIAETLE